MEGEVVELTLVNVSNAFRWLRCDSVDMPPTNRAQAHELTLVHAPDAAGEVVPYISILTAPVGLAVLELTLILAAVAQLDFAVTLWNSILGEVAGVGDAAVGVPYE